MCSLYEVSIQSDLLNHYATISAAKASHKNVHVEAKSVFSFLVPQTVTPHNAR